MASLDALMALDYTVGGWKQKVASRQWNTPVNARLESRLEAVRPSHHPLTELWPVAYTLERIEQMFFIKWGSCEDGQAPACAPGPPTHCISGSHASRDGEGAPWKTITPPTASWFSRSL